MEGTVTTEVCVYVCAVCVCVVVLLFVPPIADGYKG